MRCEIFLKVSFLPIHIQVLRHYLLKWITFFYPITFVSLSILFFSLSVMSDSLWPHGLKASLSFTISQSLLKFMSFESVMPSNNLILCHPLLLPSVFHSIRVFSNELAFLSRWSKYWSFSFGISPSNEYSGLISFRIDSLCYWTICLSLGQYHSVLITIVLYLVLKSLTGILLFQSFFSFSSFLAFSYKF